MAGVRFRVSLTDPVDNVENAIEPHSQNVDPCEPFNTPMSPYQKNSWVNIAAASSLQVSTSATTAPEFLTPRSLLLEPQAYIVNVGKKIARDRKPSPSPYYYAEEDK